MYVFMKDKRINLGTIEDFLALRLGGGAPLCTRDDDRIYGMIPTERLEMLNANGKIKGLLLGIQ